MEIEFERGDDQQPKGHALIYFRNSSDLDEIWAAYLVILPITVDVSKYVPPFLMNQVGELGAKDLSAFAFPPAPEKVEGLSRLEELAAARDDDLLFGGTVNPSDVTMMMMHVNEAVQRYQGKYSELVASRWSEEKAPDESASGFGVNEVLYGLMSDADKLSELTRLVGKLRFAAEGGEDALVREAESDVKLLATHLPEGHQVGRLIEAAKAGDTHAMVLTDRYLRRCYHLIREDYAKLGEIEAEIKELEAAEDQGESGGPPPDKTS